MFVKNYMKMILIIKFYEKKMTILYQIIHDVDFTDSKCRVWSHVLADIFILEVSKCHMWSYVLADISWANVSKCRGWSYVLADISWCNVRGGYKTLETRDNLVSSRGNFNLSGNAFFISTLGSSCCSSVEAFFFWNQT